MKTYIKPETVCLHISTQQFIATSILENGFTISDVGTTDATSGNLGRRGNTVWDDEDVDW